jgi:hypothetical protein
VNIFTVSKSPPTYSAGQRIPVVLDYRCVNGDLLLGFFFQFTDDRGMDTSSPHWVPVTAPRTRRGAISGMTSTTVEGRRESSSISAGVRSVDR